VDEDVTRQYSGVIETNAGEILECLPEVWFGDKFAMCVTNHDEADVIWSVSVDPFFEPYFYWFWACVWDNLKEEKHNQQAA
jgi:hypothetical protein